MTGPTGGEAYFVTSRALLQIAREACGDDRARASNAIVALVFAAFYVEAATNDLLHSVTTSRDDLIQDVPQLRRLRDLARAAELEGLGTRFKVKLQLISVALRDQLFDTGAQPYQDLDLLISLRNAVVHTWPETLRLGVAAPGDPSIPQEELNRLYERLIARGVVPRPDRFVLTPLFTALSTRQVAVWAVNAGIAMVEAIADALPSPGLRNRIFFAHDFTRVEL